MELKLIDKVKQFNTGQKYTQKIKTRAIRKAQINQLIENVETEIKKAISTIPEIPGKIKEYIDNKQLQAMEDQHIIGMYKFFLEYANQSEGKTGVEVDPENKNLKVIYTNFGPLFMAQFEDFTAFQPVSRQAVEGFLPDDDGLLKYFNAEIQTPKNSNEVTLIGHAVNPETMKVSPVNQTTTKDKSKALFYIRKQEELAKRKTQSEQSTEPAKQ